MSATSTPIRVTGQPAKRPRRWPISFLPLPLAVRPGTPAALHLHRAGTELDRTTRRAHEMARASLTTIAVRLGMLARTGGHPLVIRANPEFERMGREKVEAFSQSAVAMVGGLRAFHEAWWRWRAHQIDAVGRFAGSALTASHPADWLVAEARLVRHSTDAAAGAMTRFAHALTRLAGLGLDPIHLTASANARRLTADETGAPERPEA